MRFLHLFFLSLLSIHNLKILNELEIKKTVVFKIEYQKIHQQNKKLTLKISQICQQNKQFNHQIGDLSQRIKREHQQMVANRQFKEKCYKSCIQEFASLQAKINSLLHQVESFHLQVFSRKSLIYKKSGVAQKVIRQIQLIAHRAIERVDCLLLFDKKSSIQKVDARPLFNHENTIHIIKIATKIVVSFIDIPLLKEKGTKEGPQKFFIMVFSDNGCQVFHPKDNKVSFQFIHDMIVIGKSDLRIDLNNPKLTSLLGSNESQFNTQKRKAKKILGGDQTSIQSMEFYHIKFGQQSSTIINLQELQQLAQRDKEKAAKTQDQDSKLN